MMIVRDFARRECRMANKAAEYRKHADECMRLVKQMEREEQREMLLSMARTWLKMADEREQQIDRKSDATD
jgi:hypothetical protein